MDNKLKSSKKSNKSKNTKSPSKIANNSFSNNKKTRLVNQDRSTS
jgi:hypothetical protein